MEGDRQTEPLIHTDSTEGGPAVSPDGQWIAYHANVTADQSEVYIDHFPQLGDRRQISIGGGRYPIWSPDGSELFYRSVDGRQVMTVAISTEPTLAVGTPEILFQGDYLAPTGTSLNWDLTPDGDRFVIIKADPVNAQVSPEITVVLNWFEELKRLVLVN